MEKLTDYFPGLTPHQLARFDAMEALYQEWNARINVISRKDMAHFRTHHLLHSLAIAKAADFPAGSSVLDVGTGGGFPGIPLAVFYPEVRFTLCDSIGKKIKVAQAVADSLGLENVRCIQARAEALDGTFDFIVSRAVTDLSAFYPWIRDKYRNAVFYLKGGMLEEEIASCVRHCRIAPGRFLQLKIADWFEDPWFEEKKIVIISR